MPEPFLYYAIAPVSGLHLTCDFVVYSAGIFGSSPNYNPTSVGVHAKYREPYEYLASIPFSEYPNLSKVSAMDDITLEEISQLPNKRLRDFTCIAFEIELDRPNYAIASSTEFNNALLQDLLELGDRIIDVLRLYLFLPGEDKSIGRVGALGKGAFGAWLGTPVFGHYPSPCDWLSSVQLSTLLP